MAKLTPAFLNKNNIGQLLIEALVAISVLMVGMLAVFGVLSQSLSLNRVAADQYVAANLASEGIEIVKNLVDSGYDSDGAGLFIDPVVDLLGKKCAVDTNFISPVACGSPNVPLEFDEEDGIYGYDLTGGSPTKFTRYIELTYGGGSEPIEVRSTVNWRTRGSVSPAEIVVVDVLYDWRR